MSDDPLPWQTFGLPGADVRLGRFCVPAEGVAWMARLADEIPWQQHRLNLFGRAVNAPRLSCWMGDADTTYTYSRTRFEPRPWTPAVAELRARVSAQCHTRFNSVLCNLYRDGRDAMGWHSDDEPELGPAPVIASLSFGAPRRFRLRHRRNTTLRLELALDSGSLLLMSGTTQRNYRHDLPRAARVISPRINLTFRCVLTGASGQQHAGDA
jgi:alkylated DNA repair dioxygenase AlkB